MGEWEIRLAHEKAVRNSLCEHQNIPIPEDPEGGLKRIEIRRFNGRTFWPILIEKGHDKALFEDCKCYKSFTLKLKLNDQRIKK